MENDIPSKQNPKQAGVAILISDKANLKLKVIRRDKPGHYTLMKGIIHREYIMIINIYSPSISEPAFKKQTLLDIKGKDRSRFNKG
jgi:hypothetical protein